MRPNGRRRNIVPQREGAEERLVFALLFAGLVCLTLAGMLASAVVVYVF